jgi:hypothetical protein
MSTVTVVFSHAVAAEIGPLGPRAVTVPVPAELCDAPSVPCRALHAALVRAALAAVGGAAVEPGRCEVRCVCHRPEAVFPSVPLARRAEGPGAAVSYVGPLAAAQRLSAVCGFATETAKVEPGAAADGADAITTLRWLYDALRERIAALPPDPVLWNDPGAILKASAFEKEMLLGAISAAPLLPLARFVTSVFSDSSEGVQELAERTIAPLVAEGDV